MAKAMTTEEVRAMLRPEDWMWADGDYDAGYRNGKDDERAMLLEDVALPIAEERDRLAAELAEVKAVLVEWYVSVENHDTSDGASGEASSRAAWMRVSKAERAAYEMAGSYAEAKR